MLKSDNAAQTLPQYYKLTFNLSLKSPVEVLTKTYLHNISVQHVPVVILKPFNNHYNDNPYLLKVSVGPRFPISEYLGGDSAILVILHAYRHGASLDTRHMPSRGIGDIDSIQTTAWCPQSGPPSMIVVDP